MVEFNGYSPQNCWERISKVYKGPDNISFGKLGYTRAALKALTEEASRVGVKHLCSIIKKTNTPAIKMGCATGWRFPIVNYIKDNIQSNGKSYLFCDSVENMIKNCHCVIQTLQKKKNRANLKYTLGAHEKISLNTLTCVNVTKVINDGYSQ